VQVALAVIYAVDCSGAEALNLGATATSQTGLPAQLELSFKVQVSKKFNNFARSLGISNLGQVKNATKPSHQTLTGDGKGLNDFHMEILPIQDIQDPEPQSGQSGQPCWKWRLCHPLHFWARSFLERPHPQSCLDEKFPEYPEQLMPPMKKIICAKGRQGRLANERIHL
jgi:hypothetical protein